MGAKFLTQTPMAAMTLYESFSSMQLRTGKILGDHHADEPLWEIPSDLAKATDLCLFPPSFRRIYSTFASYCVGDYHPWSPAATYAFVSGLSTTATEWIPIMLQRANCANSAGLIALQTCFYCNQAAHNAVHYPNTRSYAKDSNLRETQAVHLQGSMHAFKKIINILRQT